jgi:hypothetical protein
MWFLPFSVRVMQGQVIVYGYELWFINFIARLLQNDAPTLRLIRTNPFATGSPPTFIRARYYKYTFAHSAEHRSTGAWWHRELVGEYLPPVSTKDLAQALSGSMRLS